MRFALTVETDGFAWMSFELFLLDYLGTKIGMASSQHFHAASLPRHTGPVHRSDRTGAAVAGLRTYFLDVATSVPHVCWDHYVDNAIEFECLLRGPRGLPFEFRQDYGYGPCALVMEEPIEFHPVAVTAADAKAPRQC